MTESVCGWLFQPGRECNLPRDHEGPCLYKPPAMQQARAEADKEQCPACRCFNPLIAVRDADGSWYLSGRTAQGTTHPIVMNLTEKQARVLEEWSNGR